MLIRSLPAIKNRLKSRLLLFQYKKKKLMADKEQLYSE